MFSKQKCTEQPAALDLALAFGEMVDAIRQVHEYCASQAKRAVNTNLTLRNWLIGGYIHHYELSGRDRATYGEGLIDTLAGKLMELQVPNCDRRQLYRYLRFFRLYPQIAGTLSPQFDMLPSIPTDGETSMHDEAAAHIAGTVYPQLALPPEKLIGELSYSHIELIAAIDEPLKRAFYEIECIRSQWSVRTLKRQIATLYFERSGLSGDTWYRENMMAEGDNPPVGLLLCTQKDHALVEYALAAIDNRLFVSKYQLALPSEEELICFLEAKRRELGGVQ